MTKLNYKLGENILDILESIINDIRYKNGELSFINPKPFQDMQIYSGMGGLKFIVQSLSDIPIKNENLVATESKSGIESCILPAFSNVKFILDPLMDTTTDPYINGFRKSSYSYIIKINNEILAEIECTGK